MSEKKRKNFSSQFKAKVALEAIRGVKTVTEIAQESCRSGRARRNPTDSKDVGFHFVLPNLPTARFTIY